MKRSIFVVLIVVVTLLGIAVPLQAHDGGSHHGGFHHGGFHHERPFFGGSIWIGPGWDPWWWGPPYYSAAPLIVPEQPPVYMQPAPQQEEQSYWYFCNNPQGYYPYVKQCPSGWLKVIPSVVPPDW